MTLMTVSGKQESIDGVTAGRDDRATTAGASTNPEGHVMDTSVEFNELALTDNQELEELEEDNELNELTLRKYEELKELESFEELDIHCYPESNW